jgi:hypothetical protein
MAVFTRRTVLTGAVATTAVGSIGTSLPVLAADARTRMALFIGLSSALTGIAENKLNPQRKPNLARDPLNVKQAIFDQAATHPAFDLLLETYEPMSSRQDPDAAAKLILDKPEIRYLARSVMLAWYLGAWYEPDVLEHPPAVPPPIPFKVISPATYTQGQVWRVAQTHPMGYSEWTFGYWSKNPDHELTDFIANNE